MGLLLVALLGCSDGPPAEIPDVPFEQLRADAGWVRVRGTAHYATTLTEEVPATALREGTTRYLFGLFPDGDVRSRGVKVLVRTERQPEELVDYETILVEGKAMGPTEARLPPRFADLIGRRSGYGVNTTGLVVIDAHRVVGEGPPAGVVR